MDKHEEDKGVFINIQSWMVKSLGLKGNELIIYALVHGFCQDGMSYFYGSVKYIMENTNLSKETVLSVLQNLVKKGLIVKKDVKSYKTFDIQKSAQGAQHFCLYYTSISRKKSDDSAKDYGSRNFTRKTEDENELKSVNENENNGSRILTRTESRVKNFDSYGSRNLTRAGQEFRPNNKFDNKEDNSTSSVPENIQIKNTEEAADFSLQNKIKIKLNELFGYPVSFSPSPIPKILSVAQELNMPEPEILEYLEWVYGYLKNKCSEPENFDGYFYKSFPESHLMAKFKNTQEKKKLAAEQKALQIIDCPVCGNKHNKDDLFCNVCGLECDSLVKPDEIQKQKKIFGMDKEKRQLYEAALQKAENEYPVTTRFYDKETRENYEFRIIQIETQFGLYEPEEPVST